MAIIFATFSKFLMKNKSFIIYGIYGGCIFLIFFFFFHNLLIFSDIFINWGKPFEMNASLIDGITVTVFQDHFPTQFHDRYFSVFLIVFFYFLFGIFGVILFNFLKQIKTDDPENHILSFLCILTLSFFFYSHFVVAFACLLSAGNLACDYRLEGTHLIVRPCARQRIGNSGESNAGSNPDIDKITPNIPLEQFDILPLIPLNIGDLYFSFTNPSLFMLLTLSLVLLILVFVSRILVRAL